MSLIDRALVGYFVAYCSDGDRLSDDETMLAPESAQTVIDELPPGR